MTHMYERSESLCCFGFYKVIYKKSETYEAGE